jgi:hypothetical protein
MTKPIPDKAEVVLEYPEKFYAGTFERSARFDAHFDERGVSLLLDHPGDADTRKSVHLHVHHALFAGILSGLARTVSAIPMDDTVHREALSQAAKALSEALAAAEPGCICHQKDETPPADDMAKMSPDEEVLLLHVME